MASGIANSPLTRFIGTAAGTTVIMAHPGNFDSVVIGTTTPGTATFFNTNAAGGTTLANLLMTINGTVGTLRPLGYCTVGLTVVNGAGTIDCLIAAG